MMKALLSRLALAAAAVTMLALPVRAEDVLSVRTIGTDLARDLVDHTVKNCAAKGYQVSAVVVDRAGDVMAALRGNLASRQTMEIAQSKAGAVTLSGIDSGTLLKNRQDIRQELDHLNGVLVMRGGLPIVAGGHRVGAIGVSGAPGGDIDEACAKEAMDALADRIEFAD